MFPLLDKRVEPSGILYFPDDYEEGIYNPTLEQVSEGGKKYMMVMYRNPKGHSVKEYIVNGHTVKAGCASIEGDKLKCKKKSLFYVLHPLDEWKNFHELR